MSWQICDDPVLGDKKSCDALEAVIIPRAHDLGNFEVRRALPSKERQMIGSFIFFDQMGPAEFLRGDGIDVRPHPHIGLSTLTYLFDGEIEHRDSLGTHMSIKPGAVNLMRSGKGIVHSERTNAQTKALGPKLFGIQSWLALPHDMEEAAPDFTHYGEKELPIIEDHGKKARLIAGNAFGQKSSLNTHWDTLYVDMILNKGSKIPFDATYEERGIYTLKGRIEIAGDVFEPGQLLVFKAGDAITIKALDDAHFMMVGGAPMDGPRHLWWNFVSSSKERIEQAKEEWRKGRFDIVPGDEEEFIPLPE